MHGREDFDRFAARLGEFRVALEQIPDGNDDGITEVEQRHGDADDQDDP